MAYKITAINLGSTSTKFAYYEDDRLIDKRNIEHSVEALGTFPSIWDQAQFRMDEILAQMRSLGIDPKELSAIVTRGGHTCPLIGGTYEINDEMLAMSRSEQYGNHACDLGLVIADRFARDYGIRAFTVDPPTTDEFEPLARYSGLKEIARRSSFHALNHREVARQYARDNGLDYETLNLIGIHMGGGITVCVHKQGFMVDANNGLAGDGPFSTNRAGGLPTGSLLEMAYSGQYSHKQLKKKINGQGGMMSYLGEIDMRVIEQWYAQGRADAIEALDAMCYQIAKEVGALATVVDGHVDAIYMTGGIANSTLITGMIEKRVSFIAKVVRYPGEYEMQSLAFNALGALRGDIEIKTLQSTQGG